MTVHPVTCAFCGETVETSAVDPCALVVIAGWRGPAEDQREQQFFTHAGCLRGRMDPGAAVHADVLDAANG